MALVAGIGVLAAGLSYAAAWDTGRLDPPTVMAAVEDYTPPPSPPPLLLRNVEPELAVTINKTIPFSPGPNPAALPFRLKGDHDAYERALECLTAAIYYEAGNELPDGQRAVAQVVLNRVRHPAFPQSVCGVVYQGSTRPTGCQFTFTCDGSLTRRPVASSWARARATAEKALKGAVFAPVGYATHYHADYVVPYWANSLAKNAVVGTHIFYRWPGSWGTRPAFSKPYARTEPDPQLLRATALAARGDAAPATEPLVTVATDARVELISIVQYLAAKSPATPYATGYEKDVREHFSGLSNHLAVQIFRQLAADPEQFKLGALLQIVMLYSPPPRLQLDGRVPAELAQSVGGTRKLAGFMSALRDFARHSAFDRFYKNQQAFYAEAAEKAREPAALLALSASKEVNSPSNPHRVIVAPLLQSAAVSGWQPAPPGVREPWLLIPTGPVANWTAQTPNAQVLAATASAPTFGNPQNEGGRGTTLATARRAVR